MFQNIHASSIEEVEKLKRLKTEAGVVIKQTLRKRLGKQLQQQRAQEKKKKEKSKRRNRKVEDNIRSVHVVCYKCDDV